MNPIPQPQTQRPSQKTREERRRETAAMTKCGCGNVVRLGTDKCGRCHELANEQAAREQAAERAMEEHRAWHRAIENARSVEELKPLLRHLVDRTFGS